MYLVYNLVINMLGYKEAGVRLVWCVTLPLPLDVASYVLCVSGA